MRARSGKQRFPVAQWVEDLEKLQATAIAKHAKYSKRNKSSFAASFLANPPSTATSDPTSIPASDPSSDQTLQMEPRVLEDGTAHSEQVQLSSDMDHTEPPGFNYSSPSSDDEADTNTGILDEVLAAAERGLIVPRNGDNYFARPRHSYASGTVTPLSPQSNTPSGMWSTSETPGGGVGFAVSTGEDNPLPPPGNSNTLSVRGPSGVGSSSVSLLSVESVVKEKQDFNLQNVSPLFTDSTGEYARQFEKKMTMLEGKNSEGTLCIEEFLFRSEKDWFNRYREAKLGRVSAASSASSLFLKKRSRGPSVLISEREHAYDSNDESEGTINRNSGINQDNTIEFLLPRDYAPPSGVRWLLLYRIGDWPLYSIILSLGQIIAANSYQVTLLNGEVGEPAEKLYIVATIYLVSSLAWWILFRAVKSVYVLSVPFLVNAFSPPSLSFPLTDNANQFYGSAFLFVGLSAFVHDSVGRNWMQNVATGLYAFASSSGSIFFALNFGDEGNAPVTSWVYRACVVQGSQQIYIAFLWFWGSTVANSQSKGTTHTSLADSNPHLLIGVGLGVAFFLYAIGAVTFLGLPDYYRQTPGKVPSFYRTLPRRKIIMVSVSEQHAP